MKVNVILNRRDPEGRLAFVKFDSKRNGDVSVPAYFDKSFPIPKETGDMDVMVCGVLMQRGDQARQGFDGKPYVMENAIFWDRPPKCIFIRRPDAEDVKISYRGFECSGSMCSTTAIGAVRFGTKDGYVGMVTPGRLMDYLVTADNVSVGWNGQKEKPLTPGVGYLRGQDSRLAGVDSMAELIF